MTVECVPNFSEGRDPAVIASLTRAVRETPGAVLLDTTSDRDHNRTVLTFAGSPEAMANAALASVRAAVDMIDLSHHAGVHPRIGAADVVPFVPIEDASLDECAAMAHELGHCIWDDLRVPVYFYEAAAGGRPLEEVRRDIPLGLAPDIGSGRHPTAGACVVGARRFLIAWNINLRTTDLAAARAIARAIRQSSGGLRAVKALGLPLASRGQVQVSINLVDFEVTPLYVVFDAVADLCRRQAIDIAGSELIGMIPAAALAASEGHDLRWENLRPELILDSRAIARALRSPE